MGAHQVGGVDRSEMLAQCCPDNSGIHEFSHFIEQVMLCDHVVGSEK